MKESAELTASLESISRLRKEVNKRVFGMEEDFEFVVTALLAGGHVILEGVPGVAKTLLLKSVAEAINIDFERIQMTVDLLPSDIIGQEVFDKETGGLEFRKGPLFTEILLADELNRSTPKTKSALLEAAAEKQVTLTVASDSESRQKRTVDLSELFTVFATQNPLEQMGTYPLAEAERDRFMFKKFVGYPSEEDELLLADLPPTLAPVNAVMTREDILNLRTMIWENVHISDEVKRQLVSLVRLTRPEESKLAEGKLKHGASPRAPQALVRASKVRAFLNGRDYVLPNDIMELAYPVLCHRVIFASRKKEEWEGVLLNLLQDIFKEIGFKESTQA